MIQAYGTISEIRKFVEAYGEVIHQQLPNLLGFVEGMVVGHDYTLKTIYGNELMRITVVGEFGENPFDYPIPLDELKELFTKARDNSPDHFKLGNLEDIV